MKSDSKEEVVSKFQQPGRTKLIKGSILAPENAGLRFVLNVSNLAGKVEGPLHALFDKKWKRVKAETRGNYVTKTGAYKLGLVSTIAVQSDTWVLNMLAQGEDCKTDVKSLEECLKKVRAMALYEKATVHVSALLVSAVPEISDLLTKQLVTHGVSVYYYEEV